VAAVHGRDFMERDDGDVLEEGPLEDHSSRPQAAHDRAPWWVSAFLACAAVATVALVVIAVQLSVQSRFNRQQACFQRAPVLAQVRAGVQNPPVQQRAYIEEVAKCLGEKPTPLQSPSPSTSP